MADGGADPAGPAGAVERALARTAARMAGLPICNPALRVEAVGFQPWQGRWLGATVTPWAVSLLLLPGTATLDGLGPDRRQRWSFPGGELDFVGSADEALAPCQACSLLSPVHELWSQEEGVAFARAALAALLQPQAAPASPAGAERGAAEPAAAERGDGPPRGLTRRSFLRGGR